MTRKKSAIGFRVLSLLGVLLAGLILQAGADDKYRAWLEEEVHLLITTQEEQEFKLLESDAGREEFIVRFWEKRDPTPGTAVNEFREEYSRRVKRADVMFTYAGIKGSQRTLGRVYIVFGPPKRRDGTEVNHGG